MFSRTAPQQPRKPSRNSIAPMASMMYAPVKSRGLAATISRNPVGSTMTQIPMPSRQAPPSYHGRERRGKEQRVNSPMIDWILQQILYKEVPFECSCSTANVLCKACDSAYEQCSLHSSFPSFSHYWGHVQQAASLFLKITMSPVPAVYSLPKVTRPSPHLCAEPDSLDVQERVPAGKGKKSLPQQLLCFPYMGRNSQ